MSRIQSWSTRHLVIVVVAVCAVLVSVSVAVAATTKLSGKGVTAVRTAVDPGVGPIFTSNTTMTDMPGMSTTIGVPAGEKAILVITFSAEGKCTSSTQSETCRVRVLVNGNEPPPGIVEFAGVGDTIESHSMQWVSGPLNAGSYTVKVQWATFTSGMTYTVNARALSVLRSRY